MKNMENKRLYMILVFILLVLYYFKDFIDRFKSSMYYHPISDMMYQIPEGVQDVYIQDKDGLTLNAWYYKGNSVKTILYCHGNAGNITYHMEIGRQLMANKISFLIFDYKGFGKSEGTTIVNSTYDDVREWMYYLINEQHINKNDIIPMGNSIGSFPAAKLAAIENLPKLIILGGFHSVSQLVLDIFVVPINYLVSYFIRGDLNTGKYLEQYKNNYLILHSPNDEIIPYKNAILNNKSASINNKKGGKLVDIDGGHNDPILNWNIINDFIMI